jgi:uncharacterized protein YggE
MHKQIFLPLWLAGITMTAVALHAETMERTISVTGQGTATAPPDMATIRSGVVTQGKTAGEALQANNGAMQQLMQKLKDFHIADKDIQTSNFQVSPLYQRDPDARRSEPRISGYQVSNQVAIHIRNLPELGKLLDALVSVGSNQISQIGFGMGDPTGLLNEARNAAIADARSRAQLYAQAAGVSVGQVLAISEQAAHIPRPQFMAGARMAEAASVPIATGEQEVQATINVVYELKQRD